MSVINVLLLGETGVGKSTFINAFANYLTYENLNDARNGDVLYFVPSQFTLTDKNFKEKTISIGSDGNEVQVPGASATQNPKSYVFEMKNLKLRIIDTPGIGDTRGLNYDEINADKLLNYISDLDYLNAICIMLKPNNSRLNVLFEYCIKQILTRLDKKVSENMVFIFTNARSSSYRPGDTLVPLKKILKDIESRPPYTKIPFNKDNTFCIENESFRYLVASSQGVQFDNNEKEIYEASWVQSADTCKSLVQYILKLEPLQMQGTLSINESRRIVTKLVKPVGEMIVNFEKAISLLQKHELDLKQNQNSIVDLKNQLYIPVTTFKVAQRVVTNVNSTTHGANAGISISPLPPFIMFNAGYSYRKTNAVQIEEIIVPVETHVEDKNIKSQLVTKSNAAEIAQNKVIELENLIDEYGQEAEVLIQAAAMFTVFLKENAIVSYQDVFSAYFEYLLKREREKGSVADVNMIKNLEELLVKYKSKKINTFNVSPQELAQVVNMLLSLKHCGKELKHFYEKLYAMEDNEVYSLKLNK